jgi:hypothetical protein
VSEIGLPGYVPSAQFRESFSTNKTEPSSGRRGPSCEVMKKRWDSERGWLSGSSKSPEVSQVVKEVKLPDPLSGASTRGSIDHIALDVKYCVLSLCVWWGCNVRGRYSIPKDH